LPVVLPPPETFQKLRLVVEIKESMEGVWVEGTISEKTKPGLIQTKYGDALFCTAILEDKSGRMRVNLYRDQTNVSVGDRVRIESGFTSSYGELNIGRRGKIVMLSRSTKAEI
jgi:hypothetical protein